MISHRLGEQWRRTVQSLIVYSHLRVDIYIGTVLRKVLANHLVRLNDVFCGF